jgi:hypothetical protein
MSVTALSFAVAAAAYTGFQWTIRVVVYPQFSRAAAAGNDLWTVYEAAHQRLVSLAVGPLFAALGITSLAALARPPAGVGRWLPALGVAFVAVVLAATALLAVPLHGRLARRWHPGDHRRLMAVDTLRLVASVAATVVAVAMVAAG